MSLQVGDTESAAVSIAVLAGEPMSITLHPHPGRLVPIATVAQALRALDELLVAIQEDQGASPMTWGVSDAQCAADGSVTVSVLPQRVVERESA